MDQSFYVWGALPSGPRPELRVLRTRAGDEALATARVQFGELAFRRLRALDRSLSLLEWQSLSGDTRLADAMVLLSGGLCCLRWTGGQAGSSLQPEALTARLLQLDWDRLYSVLTHQANPRFGLINGFRMVLAIERCHQLSQLQALSLLFVDALWMAGGEEGLRPVCERLTRWRLH